MLPVIDLMCNLIKRSLQDISIQMGMSITSLCLRRIIEVDVTAVKGHHFVGCQKLTDYLARLEAEQYKKISPTPPTLKHL